MSSLSTLSDIMGYLSQDGNMEKLMNVFNSEQFNKHITVDDEQITNSMKLNLCTLFNIAPVAINIMHNNESRLTRAIRSHVRPFVIPSIFQKYEALTSKFGIGSLVISASTCKDFYMGNYDIPDGFKLLVKYAWVVSHCPLIYFLPSETLKLIGIPLKTTPSSDCILTALVYHEESHNFVFWQCGAKELEEYSEKLKQLFGRNVSREERMQNMMGLFYSIQMNRSPQSLKHIIIPSDIPLSANEDPIKTTKVKQLLSELQNLYDECIANDIFSNINYGELNGKQLMESLLTHCTQFMDPIQELIDLVGKDAFYCAFWNNMKQDPVGMTIFYFNRFMMKVHGRTCSFCGRREKRNDNNQESYKICRGCKFVRYCSRTCQKKAWKLKHRERCTYLAINFDT
eukprot:1000765_1